MEITLATDSHVPQIVEVWKEFMDFHKDIDPRFPMRENAHLDWEKHLRDLMKSEDTLVLVALDKDYVVGYSISLISKYPPVFERETYGFIASMAVQSNYRRKGIGERMLGKIYEWFESRNIDKIELTVTARNQLGYSFWKKHGFKDYTHRLYLDKESIPRHSPMTEHFCHSCNRLRLTSDGQLRPCLLDDDEVNVKEPLRNGASTEELKQLIQQAVAIKRERHHLSGGLAPGTVKRPMCQIGG